MNLFENKVKINRKIETITVFGILIGNNSKDNLSYSII